MKTGSDSLFKCIGDGEYWRNTFEKLNIKTTLDFDDINYLQQAIEFDKDSIVDKIWSGTYEWQIPRKVKLKKHGTKKFRVVYIYSIIDRLVLGVLYQALSDYFSDRVQASCFSYKKGLNTGQAIRTVKDSIQSKENIYGVKIDIHAYFNSISQIRISEMLDELFNDAEFSGIKKTLQNLLFNQQCIYHDEVIQEYKGVIPGTPIASFFANYCLRECDFYFEAKGSIYARYQDDIIIIESSKDEVDKDIETLNNFIEQYGLEINPDKYQYFTPGDDITFLGIKIESDGTLDMSDHSKQKIKKQIHRWCKKGRKEIEMNGTDFMKVAKRINRRYNYKNFKCYIENEAQFGWCHYMFRYITTDKSLKELDLYFKDTLRAMKTGKHNKGNYKALTDEDFREMGWVSLVQLYHLYKKDFDYYCEVIDLL